MCGRDGLTCTDATWVALNCAKEGQHCDGIRCALCFVCLPMYSALYEVAQVDDAVSHYGVKSQVTFVLLQAVQPNVAAACHL
jgi:hypothetical protein